MFENNFFFINMFIIKIYICSNNFPAFLFFQSKHKGLKQRNKTKTTIKKQTNRQNVIKTIIIINSM